jgi:hypothetical protein
MRNSPSGDTIAVTAIEHRNIVITVASLVQEPEGSPSSGTSKTFITIILGGPLAGQTWESMTWSAMIRNHAGAVSRIAELVAEQAGQSDECDESIARAH